MDKPKTTESLQVISRNATGRNDTERSTDRGPGTTGLQGHTLFTGKSWVAHHRDGDLGLHNVALGTYGLVHEQQQIVKWHVPLSSLNCFLCTSFRVLWKQMNFSPIGLCFHHRLGRPGNGQNKGKLCDEMSREPSAGPQSVLLPRAHLLPLLGLSFMFS